MDVLRSDGSEGLTEAVFESEHRTSFGSAEELLDLGPALLDGIEVGGIRRQIAKLGSALLNQITHALHFVSGQIVHHHDVAGLELRAQHLFDVSQEDVTIGGRFDGHDGDPSRGTHGTQHGKRSPVPSGCAFGDSLSADATPVTSRHLRRDAAFVQKYQPFRVDLAGLFAPEAAPDLTVRGVLLGGVE